MWWLIRAFLSAIFLGTIILSIPVVFDVGGRDSGLAYSLALFAYYVVYSGAKLATSPSRCTRTAIGSLLSLSQWIVIPTLLIWSLNRFAVDAGSDWVEKTFEAIEETRRTSSWYQYVFGRGGVLESMTIGGWDKSLRYASPVFQLLEGFCTLLVIQTAGTLSRWLVNRGRSDTWVIVLLVFSSSIIATAVYFLWRVANFPQVSNLDATLIGVTMTCAVFLGIYGIGSGRGNPVESSLLFAYVVLSVYQIFTDYMPTDGTTGAPATDSQAAEFPPLPPIIMASYSTLLHFIGTLPSAVLSALSLLYAALQTITPSAITSLLYRITVFYCVTRAIPALRKLDVDSFVEGWSDGSQDGSKILELFSWFSPSILIAVYTSLLLQHFATSVGEEGWTLKGGNVGNSMWRWLNVMMTMMLYSVELYLGGGDSHWKTD